MIQIGDNFSYLGAKPLDGRISYSTLSAMVGMSASTLYDGCMAYCVETDKNYQWKSTNGSDATLGKWREVEGVAIATASTAGKVKPDDETIEVDSSGTISVVDMVGATASTAGTKGLIPSPSAGDNGKFLKGDGTWSELNTLGFTPVGTVISVMGTTAPQNYIACDGTVYNITDYPVLSAYIEEQFGTANHFGGDGTTTFAVPDLRGEFLRGTGTNSHANQGNGASVGTHQDATTLPSMSLNSNQTFYIRTPDKTAGHLGYQNYDKGVIAPSSARANIADMSATASYIDRSSVSDVQPYRYTTRPTNTTVLYCIASTNIYVDARFDYSTTEKIVGTWIDGKPLYQKTFEFGNLPNATAKTVTVPITNLGQIIDYKVSATDGTRTLPIPYVSDGTMDVQLFFTGTEVRIITLTDRTTYSAIVTIQYTKTTD